MAENPFKKVGSFVADELLGFDDARNVVAGLKEGDLGKAAKAAGAGLLEIGSTVGAAAAAVPTLGGSVAAKGAQVAAKQAAKAGVKAAVKSSADDVVTGGARVGQQFRGGVGTITKPSITPPKTKPGDLPGAPGYPRTPSKPGDLPGAPGYPKPAPAPKPAPKPLPKPLPKPAPAPAKPAPKPAKPATKPAVAPKTSKATKPDASTGKAPGTSPSSKMGPQFKNLPKMAGGAGLATGLGYMLGKKSDKKEEGPWNPSAIV